MSDYGDDENLGELADVFGDDSSMDADDSSMGADDCIVPHEIGKFASKIKR